MLDPLVRFPEFRAAAGQHPVPITLIGGFLGAGKTTLLNGLLQQAGGRRFAVLVNDFGELNLDARLVVNVGAQHVELSNGCICCTIRDDLVAGVARLLETGPPPDHLLIETSGVSDPLNILVAFLSSPELQARCWIDNVVTVVDAVHAAAAREAAYWHLFGRQIQSAYTVVLNKTGLAGAEATRQAIAVIEQHMPGAQIIRTADGQVPLPLLIDDGRSSVQSFRPVPTADDRPHPFASVAWRSLRPLRRDRFERLLGLFRGAAFRAKGLIQFQHAPAATLFQMVGALQTFTEGPPWGALAPSTELVFIGSPDTLRQQDLLDALHGCEAAPPA